MEVLKIDGSYGEGGGQILRSAIIISSITKKPIQIDNIRANRKIPGLRPQHLASTRLLANLCNAKTKGLEIGSTSIKFLPENFEVNELDVDIGTAGSIPLLLQVVIPAVAISKKSLKLKIKGGTDVFWSPTSNYTKYVLAEAFSRMGIKFFMNIKKRGYYPKGGGIIEVEILPSKKLKSISLLKRETNSAKLYCSFSKYNLEYIQKKITPIENLVKNSGFSVETAITNQDALNKGSSILLFCSDSSSIMGFDALFNKETKKDVAKDFLECNVGVDNHLADMLVTPASLINETSVFRVKQISEHLKTNLYITSKITNSKYGIGKIKDGFEVRIKGVSNS